jgi:hypothetical protein
MRVALGQAKRGQQRYVHFFPALRTVQRTTFVRQAAKRWLLKERLW